jgi:hypothetical protein
VPLLDGVYSIGIGCHTHDGGTIYADRAELDYFAVANSTRSEGMVYFPVRAHLAEREPAE